MSIMTGEIPFQTEIEACDFTRHGSIVVRFYIVSQDTDIDITNGVPFDGATFRRATNIAGLEIAVNAFTDFDTIIRQQFPPDLGECERLVSAAWLETGTTPLVTFHTGFKHCLVAFVYSGYHVLYRLTRKLFPVGKPACLFQFTDMLHQPKLADVFTEHRKVATLERDAMIPHRSVSFYRLMQLTIAVIGIQFELVGFHGVGFLAFISYSKGWGGHHQAVARNSPHESHYNYIMF